jgi:hypothetical protein
MPAAALGPAKIFIKVLAETEDSQTRIAQAFCKIERKLFFLPFKTKVI